MFLLRRKNSDTHSNASITISRESDVIECFIICNSQNLKRVIEQLTGYQKMFVPRKIMLDKEEKKEDIETSLTPANFPDYFYTFSVEKPGLFSAFYNSSNVKIKISGTLNALKTAIEALVFGEFFDANTALPIPALTEYAQQLLRGEIPASVISAEWNF